MEIVGEKYRIEAKCGTSLVKRPGPAYDGNKFLVKQDGTALK